MPALPAAVPDKAPARTQAAPGSGAWLQAASSFTGALLGALLGSWLLRAPQSLPAVPAGPPATRIVQLRAAPQAVELAPAGPALEAIRVQRFRVTLAFSGPTEFRVLPREDPPGLLLDIPGARSVLTDPAVAGQGSMIQGVRVSALEGLPEPGVRVAVSLAKPVTYSVRKDGDRIVADFYYGGRRLR